MLTRKQKAAVLFLAIPQEEREMSLDDFSKDILGVTRQGVNKWTKIPEFRDAVKSARASYMKRQGSLFEQAARAKALMIMMQGMNSTEDVETQRKFASSVLREVKTADNAADGVSYVGLSDEQLISEMFGRGYDLPTGELQKFRNLVGMEELT